MPSAVAVQHCLLGDFIQSAMTEAQASFDAIAERVTSLVDNHPQVTQAYTGPGSTDAGLVFVLVVSGESHPFDLVESIAELELELRRDYPKVRVAISTVPASRVETDLSVYLDPEQARPLHGESEPKADPEAGAAPEAG